MNRSTIDDDEDDVRRNQRRPRGRMKTEWRGGMRGSLWDTLAFASDEWESTFHIWISQNNSNTSLRVHSLLILGWLVGWIQSSVALSLEEGRTFRAMLANIIQASVVIHEVLHLNRLMSPKIELQACQHAVKAKMHAYLYLATVSMVIISSKTLFDSRWHALSAMFMTCLCIVDELPLYHLIRLHVVKLVCFEVLLFTKMFTGGSGPSLAHQMGDALMLLVMGTIISLGVASLLEYRKRVLFLHDLNERPSHFLGSFWKIFQWIGL